MTAEWLVDSINGLADTGTISREFIGLILLPIVGNAAGKSSPQHSIDGRYFPSQYNRADTVPSSHLTAHIEHVTAVTVSVKDKLTLSLGVAVGSSIVRGASPLFVAPLRASL